VKKIERNESLRQKARFMESPQCAGNDHDFKYCKCFAAWVVDATVMLWRAELGFKELRDGLLFYQCCLDMSRRIPIQKRAWEVGAVLDT